MKVAVLQSNYIPWKGYFDLMSSVDVFVLYDCVQYTKNDWRNRNQVLVRGKPVWLTIPVHQTSLAQLIQDTRTTGANWARKHWSTVRQNYARAPGFKTFSAPLGELYEQLADTPDLSRINRGFIDFVCAALGIRTRVMDARELNVAGDRNERLIDICVALGAQTYVSGPAARSYLDESLFERAGLEVEWFEYGPYPGYPQAADTFTHHISILDLMLNTGSDAPHFYRRAESYA